MFALQATSNDCLPGYYCRTASTLRSPVAEYASDYSPTPATTPITGVTNWWKIQQTIDNSNPAAPITNRNGDVCSRGSFCEGAVSSMKTCYPGYYCPDPLMKAHDATLKCRLGFYCKAGAYSMTPGNPWYFPNPTTSPDKTGDICRKGNYCPENSSKQFTCEPGKFMPYEMAALVTECIACPDGKYCDVSGIYDLSTKDCDAGYYCATSAINPRQFACNYDEICPTGSKYPKKCLPEEYTTTAKATVCQTCADGKRCIQGSVTDCSAGTYCKSNTVSYCPPGKYGKDTVKGQSTIATACTDCEIGWACSQPNSRSQCSSGFLCNGSATFRRPNGGSDNGVVCSPGNVCVTAAQQQDQCEKGRYCPNWGSAAAEGLCYAGYFCGLGFVKPTQSPCQPGHYCPSGSEQMTKCPPGTYNDGLGATSRNACKTCPEGVQCDSEGLAQAPIFIWKDTTTGITYSDVCSVNNTRTSPSGSVCPTGAVPCPKGSYCAKGTAAGSDTVVKLCAKGYFCPGTRA